MTKSKGKVASKPRKASRDKTAVLAAAKKLKDPAMRAAALERDFDRVDKPAKLVQPWISALTDSPMTADQIGQHVLAACRARAGDIAFVEAAGRELDQYSCDDAAIDALRLVLASGSASPRALATLGRLLAQRGDPDAVAILERAIARAPGAEEPRRSLASWYADGDPARALEVLESVEDAWSYDLRALLLERLGRKRQAAEAAREALALYDSELEGRQALCEWHAAESRYPRALMHARKLLALRNKASAKQLAALSVEAVHEIDATIASGYRLGGAFPELVPWLRKGCESDILVAGDLPGDLAWQIYEGLTSLEPNPDPELAIHAARACAVHAKHDAGEVACWHVREAKVHARDGDVTALQALAGTLGDHAEAWVELAYGYISAEHYDAAAACIDRAFVIDAESPEALSALFDVALASGDGDALHRASEAIAAAKPHWHQGPEHLARSFARRGDGAAAIAHAERAVKMAPYCHNAWIAQAEALIVTGDLARARASVDRSRQIDQEGDSLLQAALDGDPDRLEREIADLPGLPFAHFVERLRAVARAEAERVGAK